MLWLGWLLCTAELLSLPAAYLAPHQLIVAAKNPKKSGKEKKNQAGKGQSSSTDSNAVPADGLLDLSAPPPADPGEAGSIDFGGGLELDLGGGAGSSDAAVFEFGNDDISFDFGGTTASTKERENFEAALRLMSNDQFAEAALQFHSFLQDQAYATFAPESQYQLAKSLYKLGFLEDAEKELAAILEQGPSHARYRKAVEWLFYMSRRLADQTSIMARLAKYRNVTFPKAYRAEFFYLLAKYLFEQADRFETERIQTEDLARGKQSKEAGIDFGAVASAIESADGFDFGGGSGASGGGALDFGGSADAGAAAGGFDFGAVMEDLDFGGGDAGGFDFGGGDMDMNNMTNAPSDIEQLPTNSQEAVKQGLALLTQVPADSSVYAKSRYLAGLLHYINNEDQAAVDAYQEVVRILQPKDDISPDPKLRELAFLSLARIHYGYKQFQRSVYYYDMIDRDSENWLTSLFESSWAYYRRGDFDKALGNLLTLHAPFFEKEYFPESYLVKAIIYFEACRYQETREQVDQFIKQFTSVMKEVQKIAEFKGPKEEVNGLIAQLRRQIAEQTTQDDTITRVLNLTVSREDIRTAQLVLDEAINQKKMLEKTPEEFQQSTLGKRLAQTITDTIQLRLQRTGEVTRQAFEQELYKLKSLLAQALRIKIEVTRSERDRLEMVMRGQDPKDDLVAPPARRVVDDEHIYWPYEGEYWRDELGTYELDFSMCQVGQGA